MSIMLKTHIVLMIISNSILSSIANSIEENVLDGQTLEKKGRFISFNNHEGEIKIELDFAIPFMKVPLRKSDGSVQHPTLDVNTRGLVTVGSMLFLFIAIVPKIVQLFVPQAQATATETFYPLMGRVEEALQSMDISTTECYQRAACWVAGKTLVNSPFSNARNSQWIGAMIDNDAVQDAFNKGMGGEDCSVYHCPLSMNVIAQMFKAGRQLLV